MHNMKRALSIVLVVSVAAAPCSLGAEDTGAGRSNAQPTEVVVAATANEQRAGLRMLGDDQLGELVARAEATHAASASAAPGGGGHKKKTLIIVGAAVIVAVFLVVSIRESCKKQGAECLKK